LPFIPRFIDFLIRWRWPLFALGLFLMAAAYVPSRYVTFDRSIERMFAQDDPLLAPYQRLKREFGGNEIVMAVYQDDLLLDPDGRGLKRLEDISRRIETVPGIHDVLSLAKINQLLEQLEKGKKLASVFELFRESKTPATPAILNPDSPLAARYRDLFSGYTHSADGHTAAIVCMLKPASTDAALNVPREDTLAGLEKIIRELPDGLPPGVLAGEPVMLVQGFAMLEEDGRRLGIWTMIFLGGTILLFFRSLRWLVIPLAVVQWSLIVTRAILALSGLALSMVSSLLTAIVTVVGVATVMHLIVHVRELRTQGRTQRDALLTAGSLLAAPIVGAILTDIGGFGALAWATVAPVRDFGIMMVIGSLLVIPATCLIVPALALLAARDQPTPKPGWGEVYIGYWLMRSIDLLHSHPLPVAIVTGVIALFASLGVMRLEVETDFTRNFRRSSAVVRSYEFVETRLGGAGVWDVIVPAPAKLDRDYLARVRALEEQLRTIELPNPATGKSQPALTKVLSVVDALDAVDADPTLAALTTDPELRFQGLAAAMPSFLNALRFQPADKQPANETEQPALRIMLRASERQPAEQKQRLIDEVTRLAHAAFPSDLNPEPREYSRRNTGLNPPTVTGYFVLLTNLVNSITRDQWVTFGIASAAIMALVLLGFRSWKYALVAMIPNAVPIYMVMGLLGWFGLKINMGAAMIAAVSMGMSVDSSIHYYAAFRRARREGKTVHAALAQCQQSVGLAMIFSTLALIIGFGVLITSDFVPTIYFGALMSLAMLGGMLGNLIVLPLLLSWTERDS
jgi:predicted RND superfamily exporter protein